MRPSFREIALNACCLLLLVVILAPAGYFVERWMELHLEHPFWNPVWHEPRDNWNLLSGRQETLCGIIIGCHSDLAQVRRTMRTDF